MFPDFSSEVDQAILELGRTANQLFCSDKKNEAIEKAREIWVMMPHAQAYHGINLMLRLPQYLQNVGRLDEAIQCYQKLIDDTDHRFSIATNTHPSKNYHKESAHKEIAEIYAEMASVMQKRMNKYLVAESKNRKRSLDYKNRYLHECAKEVLKELHSKDAVFGFAQCFAHNIEHSECAELDGKLWHKDDPKLKEIISTHWKIVHERCSCRFTMLTAASVERKQLIIESF